ncbi:MAG: PVC-type heme-binding CxxCH protein, partial [Verrucomicrobiota bacterium]
MHRDHAGRIAALLAAHGEPTDDGSVRGTVNKVATYEQSVTSFGDVFQNDNDDPPACRVSHVMEYANFGFCSSDGERSWRTDQRPGQPIPVAEWRQEDPGIFPAGDVYGGGSPTGTCFYENGVLGSAFRGMFLACEAGRNVVFGYLPKPQGATFSLDRFDFLTSNPAGEHSNGKDRFAGSDFLGGSKSVRDSDERTLFRPSDAVIGPDGALYVSDWYDPRVGGHQDLDDSCSGAIYRVAPKNFTPSVPAFDRSTIDGAIIALRSPATNVREIGRASLRAKGELAIPALDNLLKDENPYIGIRAIWVLAQLGEPGLAKVRALLSHQDPQFRIAAFRALQRMGEEEMLPHAMQFASDENPAVRREAALAVRDLPFAPAQPVILAVAAGYDGQDRSYLEALGTGCTGKEEQAFVALRASLGAERPQEWSDAFADIAWRLGASLSVLDLQERAADADLSKEARKQAVDALAFIKSPEAANALLAIASSENEDLQKEATWWLLNRMNNDWRDYGLAQTLKENGIYDPATHTVTAAPLPKPTPAQENVYPPLASLLEMQGDPKKGASVANRCIMCHKVNDVGV